MEKGKELVDKAPKMAKEFTEKAKEVGGNVLDKGKELATDAVKLSEGAVAKAKDALNDENQEEGIKS